ncbi:MAG: hypothetical protein KDD60_02295 [Bdellovibrionales bacterium]|nr:hypothetical protein [Bdellovibrionales bacterium]
MDTQSEIIVHGDRAKKSGSPRNVESKFVLFAIALSLVLAAIAVCFRWIVVQGSERVVWQTYQGVKDEVGEDGLHFYFGLTTTPYRYYIGSDTFIVDDKTVNPTNNYMTKNELAFNQPDVPPVVIPVMMDRVTDEDLLYSPPMELSGS